MTRRSASRFSFVLIPLLGLAAPSASWAVTEYVWGFGSGGWYSSDTRSSSGVNLYGATSTHPGWPVTYSAAHDTTIAQQITWLKEGESGAPLGTAGGRGSVRLYATDQNAGKAHLSVYDATTGFGSTSLLLDPSFYLSYRYYDQPATQSRTVGSGISIVGTNSNWYAMTFVNPTNAPNIWQTATWTSASLLYLYGPSAPGGALSQSLTAWANDPTWGPIVFGQGAFLAQIGFNLGSYQRNEYTYLDWMETPLLNGGDRIDFGQVPEPGTVLLLAGAAPLLWWARRKQTRR